MENKRWHFNRAGLVNFWYYDEQDLYFSGGRLMLRGDNGAGKSVTMQSLIPLLLDGKKSPDRLDPFGSRARKIEDYLLGEKALGMSDERTGYLYLEFKREELEQYRTIGIGLKAKRGQKFDFWGFSITDNRRIGFDLKLYKEISKDEKIPLTRKELENRIGQGGQVVRSQNDYMKMVNQLIFGFENLENYDELIKLLIQLRSPKLSKDFKPTVIYEILNDSLPALSDEDLRSLSETIENMDTVKEQLDQLNMQRESAKKLKNAYHDYNRYLIYEKADEYLKTAKNYSDKNKEMETLIKRLEVKRDELELKLKEKKEDELDLESANQIKADLEKNDAFQAEQERQRLEQEKKDDKIDLQRRVNRLEEKEEQERNLMQKIRDTEYRMNECKENINEEIEELDDLAYEGFYTLHDISRDEFLNNLDDYTLYESWKKEVSEYRKKLKKVCDIAQKVSDADKKQQERKRELGDLQAKLEKEDVELRKSEYLLEDERENFMTQFYEWQKGNHILSLLPEASQKITRLVQDYPVNSYEEIKEPARKAFDNQRFLIKEEQLDLIQKKKTVETQMNELREEWVRWKNISDPEPDRHPEVDTARQLLKEKGIPHVPFFTAVEFRDGVSEEEKARLESVLLEIGILDALIIPEKYEKAGLPLIENMADSYLKRNQQILRPTLFDYLKPSLLEDSKITSSDIDEILRSILIFDEGDQETFVNPDGNYAIGLRRGKASSIEKSIYIGREARKKYRQEMLENINKQMEETQEILRGIEEKIGDCEERLTILEDEFCQFPTDEKMREVYELYDEYFRRCKTLKIQVEAKNEEWKKTLESYQRVNQEFKVLLAGENLPSTLEQLNEALEAMQSYESRFYELVDYHRQYKNCLEQIKSINQQVDELMIDLDEIRVSIRDLRNKIQAKDRRITELEELLQEKGIDEIQRQIRECINKIETLPGKIKKLERELGNLENDIERDEVSIEKQGRELADFESLKNHWQKAFIEESNLSFYQTEKEKNLAVPLGQAKKVKSELKNWIKQHQLDREKIKDKLFKVFHAEMGYLIDFRITMRDQFKDDRPDTEDLSIEWKNYYDLIARLVIEVDLEGRKVSPYTLFKYFEDAIEANQILLTEQDRQLYEDILMQNVGQTIRNRIHRAERWVKEMNHLMVQRDTSSGLTFSLQWKPKPASNEKEMDIKDLVELLKKDSKILREKDIRRVAEHFRSRIERAREILEDKGYGESLHRAIQEVLDYRKWFQFILYYQKTGERKKELTNHVFNTFSGGEKAMSMYIPLFSAVFSHYEQARPDAPRIITLDEAFAGVDENNIRDMFDLVEQLGFDFIMNSQALWGDYDTVSHLSIAELIRPKNATYVSVIHYYWDGKVRKLQMPEWFEIDLSGEMASTRLE